MSLKKYTVLSFLILTISGNVFAEWNIVTHTDTDSDAQTEVAYTKNKDGYSLEIYRDASGTIRSRFGMKNALLRLAEKSCPTFQVDKREITNRSTNDARCISNQLWAEFILGYISNNEVRSTSLHNIMNGHKIYYRFILENGGYGETDFSLSGSKNILRQVLGRKLKVRTDSGFSVD